MIILSFDIGIRNLAYCVYDNTGVGSIKEWNVVDILSYGEEGNTAHLLDISKKWKKEQFVKWFTENGLDVPKNKTEMLTEMKKIVKADGKGKTKEKLGIDFYTKKILSWLDAQKQFLDCDMVALENQPCMKNPIMKTIQTVIYTYFYYFGVLHGNMKSVKLVSATNKLKIKPEGFVGDDKKKKNAQIVLNLDSNCVPVEEGTTSCEKKKEKDKDKYAKRKSLSNEYTRHYIEKMDGELLLFWESHGKKDDLSDCFLQAIYVSKNM